jgi:methionyl-tRNA formyltransferase
LFFLSSGLSETAATLIQISENVDEGDLVDQVIISIGETDTIADLMTRVTEAYIILIEKHLIRCCLNISLWLQQFL